MDNQEMLSRFLNMCYEFFKDCDSEQELNDRYEELRQLIVCEMSDRAEELGLDPDTL